MKFPDDVVKRVASEAYCSAEHEAQPILDALTADDLVRALDEEMGATARIASLESALAETRRGKSVLVEHAAKTNAALVEVTRQRDEALRMDTPWPIPEVLRKLADAADILLHQRNYDGHGHEEIGHARDAARAFLAATEPKRGT